eukprot:jgi/Mesvir1/27328/Mv26381-RA.1
MVSRTADELRMRREAQARYRQKHLDRAALQVMRAMAKKDTWMPTEKWLQKHGTDCDEVKMIRKNADLPEKDCKSADTRPVSRAPTSKLWTLAEVMETAQRVRPENQPVATVQGDRVVKTAKGATVATIKQYVGRVGQILDALGCSRTEPVTCLLDISIKSSRPFRA